MASINLGKKPNKEDESPYSFLNKPKSSPSGEDESPYSFLNKPKSSPSGEDLSPYSFLNRPPVVQNVSATEARKIGSSMMGGMAGLGLNTSALKTPEELLAIAKSEALREKEELAAIAKSEALREKEDRLKYGFQNLSGLFATGALEGAAGTAEGFLTVADAALQANRKAFVEGYIPGEGAGASIGLNAEAEEADRRLNRRPQIAAELARIDKTSYLEPAIAKVGEFRQAVKDVYPVDPDVAASIPGQTIGALGQVFSQLPLAMTGLGIPAVVNQMFDQQYQEALTAYRKAGKTEAEAKELALAAGFAAMPLAAFEQLGNVAKLKTLRDAFRRNPTQRAARDLAEAFGVESATETIQQGGSNIIAESYDPKRSILQGTGTAAAVGGLAGFGTSLAGIGAGRIIGSENPKELAKQDPRTLFPDQKRAVLDMLRKDYANLPADQQQAIDNYDLNLPGNLRRAIEDGAPVDIEELSDYNKNAKTPIVLPKDWVQDGDYYVPKGYVAPVAPGTPAAAAVAPGTPAEVVAPGTPAAAVAPGTPAAAAAAAVTPAPAPPEIEPPLAVKTNEELDQAVEYANELLATREMTKAEHKKEMAKIKKQRLLAPAIVEETPASAPLAATGTPVTSVVAEAAPKPVASEPVSEELVKLKKEIARLENAKVMAGVLQDYRRAQAANEAKGKKSEAADKRVRVTQRIYDGVVRDLEAAEVKLAELEPTPEPVVAEAAPETPVAATPVAPVSPAIASGQATIDAYTAALAAARAVTDPRVTAGTLEAASRNTVAMVERLIAVTKENNLSPVPQEMIDQLEKLKSQLAALTPTPAPAPAATETPAPAPVAVAPVGKKPQRGATPAPAPAPAAAARIIPTLTPFEQQVWDLSFIPGTRGAEAIAKVLGKDERAVTAAWNRAGDKISEQEFDAARRATPAPAAPVAATPAPAPTEAQLAAPAPAPAPAKKPRRVAKTVEDFILPKILKAAKTFYRKSALNFTSDLDLALYIVSSKKPSKQRPAYLDWVMKSTGLTEAQALSEGAKIRTEIAKRYDDSSDAPISLPVTSTRKNLVRQSLTEDPTHLTLSEDLPTEQWWARFNVQHARNMGFRPDQNDLRIVIENAPVVDPRKQFLSGMQAEAEAELEVWKKNNPKAPKILVVSRPEWQQNGRGVQGQHSVDGGIVINSAYAMSRGSTISKVASHEYAHALIRSLQGQEALQNFAARSIPEDQMAAIREKYPRQQGETEIEYNLKIAEEWIARNAETQPGVFQAIVEAMRGWLAKAGLVNLSNEEIARAMLRVLRSSNSDLAERESAITRQSLTDRAALLDSPNFKRWFGNSKMVDEDGNPKVFYHGTTSGEDFSTFDGGIRGVIFVSPSPEVADYFALSSEETDNARVFPLYVRAENPFEFWNADHLDKVLSRQPSKGSSFRERVSDGSWAALATITDDIKAAGFDSYYEMEMGQINLGVFDPNQLKSTVNRGEYSRTNNDVAYSLTDEDLGTSIKRPFSEEGRKRLQEYQKTGDLDRARYDENIAQDIPALPRVPIPTTDTLPTTAELKRVMGKRLGNGKINTAARDIPKGTSISVRQDVPSQTEYGVGVVTVRDSSTGRLYYQSFLRFLEPQLRPTRGMENASLRIGAGEQKNPTIVATGKMHPYQSLPKDLDTWTQVGFNPDRHSYMYDRATGTPVVGGSEAIQVGNTVFVKDPVFGNAEEFRYSLTDESVNDRTPIDTPRINTVLTPEEIAAVDKRQIRDLDIGDLLRKGILTERHAKMLSELMDKSGGDTRIEVVDANDLPPRAMGAWDGKTNRILLSRDSKMNLGRVLLHEYVHALTFMGLRFGDRVMLTSTGALVSAEPRLGVSDSDLREASERMDKLFSIALKAAYKQGKKSFYGLTNREEFVAEAFSSKKFQNFLSSIPSTNGGKQSLFDQFIAIVKKILGTENDSLLTDVISATDPFVGATRKVYGVPMVDERSMLPFGKSIRQSLTDESVNDRTQISIPELTGPVRNRVKSTGQYVGMPPGINTPEKLERLRDKLVRMARDGMEGRYWYEKSSKKILQITQGNRKDAEVLAAFIAAYSPQNRVYPNLGQAIRAYYEYKAGKKITVGKMATDIARGQSVADGERWEGVKTNNFYINLMVEINPELIQGSTVDMWIMRVWGYRTDVPGDVRYARVQREISLIADRLTELEADKYAKDLDAYNSNPTGEVPVAPTPWEPQQVQAAIWVAGKARYEEAAALAKEKGKKLGEYVKQAPDADGERQWAWVNAKNPNVPDKEIAAKWGKRIFKAIYATSPVDISDSKNDFADYVLRDVGQVSSEVRPGSSTGDMPGMETAPPAQQLEYLAAMRNALLDEGGNNVVDRELGILVLGEEILPGVWKDETNPSVQTSVSAPRGSGVELKAFGSRNRISVTNAELLDSKVAIEAILFKQDGAGWHRPFFVDGDNARVGDANGLALRIGRGMTANELQSLRRYVARAGLKEVSDFSSIAIISEPKGARFIYFFNTKKYSEALESYNRNPVGQMPVAPISNTEFQKRMKSAAEAMARAYAGLEFNLGRFASEGNLIENDWRKNPNGETYRQRLAETGRSDILRRIQDLYGPKIRRINFIFAQKYGWDNPAKYAEQLEPAGTPQEEIAQADASDAAFAAEDMGVPEPPLVKGSTPGVRDNQLGPRYSLMDEPISPRFTDVQMAWNKGEMTRDQYDEAMAELVKNPEGIEYPATGPAIPLVMSVDRTIGGKDLVDLPTVYKSVINVLQTLGDSAVIRTGRYAGPASGLYKEFENVIRLRKGMDRDGLPIVSHELGHSIAKSVFGTVKSSALRQALRYDPNNLPVVKQLEDLGKKLYGPTRPAIGYTGEGFAEFVRLWMTNDADLTKYGQTTAWFEKTFIAGDPKLGASLNSAKKQLTLWRLQGSRDRGRAMSSEPKALDKLLYRLRKETSFARRVEEFAALELLSKEYLRRTGTRLRADQDPYILASALRSTAGGVLHSWVTLGITDIYGRQVGPSLKEAYALIKSSQEEDFRLYLVSLQSQIRLKQGKDPGMGQADADNNVASLSIQYPHFAKAALDISKWWDKALDYQLMAFPEMNYQLTAAVRAANPVYYGPLMRQFTEEEKASNKVKGTSYVIKEAKGSARKLENLFLSSVRMAEGIIAKAQKDMVLKLVTDLAKTEGMGWLVEKVAVGKVMKSVDIGSIREQLESYGVDTSKLSDDAMLEYATNADARDAKDPIISIRRSTPTATDPNATTLEWYQVPREIADILQGVPDVGRLGLGFEIIFGGPNRLAKMGYVSLSISFQLITNPIRDLYTVFMAALYGNPIEVGVGLAKAYGRLIQGSLVAVTSQDFRNKYLGGLEESEISQIAQQLGLSNSTYIGGDIQEAKRLKTFLFHGKVFTTLASPVESLRSVLSFTETAPRLSQLELAITELGWKTGQDLTPEQAIAGMLAYKRATVDFSAKGNEPAYLRKGLLGPFYSAGVQGTRTLARALPFRSNPKKAVTSLLTGLTMMTLPALLSWYKYKDEEWWKNLPLREKSLYWHFVVGDEVVRIPLPQEFGTLFVGLPIAIADAIYKEDPKALTVMFGQIASVFNPVDMPVLLKAGKEYVSNRRSFTDTPIVPGALQKVQLGSQFNPNTGMIAKKLGEIFPNAISPIKLENLVRSVAGSVGLNTLKGVDIIAEELGLTEGKREPDASDTWFYGKLFRPGGKITSNAASITEFFDDYQRLESRKLPEDKARETGETPLNPLTMEETRYFNELEGRYEDVTFFMGLARKENRRSERQRLYLDAAKLAREGLNKKPDDPLLPW